MPRKKKEAELIKCSCKEIYIDGLEKIVSINQTYRPMKNKKGKMSFRKDPNILRFQNILTEKLQESGLKEYKNKGEIYLSLGLKFYLKKNYFYKRDASNFLKSTEDVISRCIGIDDRFVIHLFLQKIRTDQNNTEAIGIFLGFHTSESCFKEDSSCLIIKKFLNFQT